MYKQLFFLIILLAFSCSSSKKVINEKNEISSKGNFKDNKKTGIWKYFYSNGNLHQKGKYKDDKQNGIWKFYFDSGELMGFGEFSDNNQIGLWKWFHKNGNLYTERLYNYGKLEEIKSCFDKNRIILDCGKVINGNGKMIYHDIENESDSIEIFEFENGIIKNYR